MLRHCSRVGGTGLRDDSADRYRSDDAEADAFLLAAAEAASLQEVGALESIWEVITSDTAPTAKD